LQAEASAKAWGMSTCDLRRGPALQAEALAKAWGMSTCNQRRWSTAQRVLNNNWVLENN